MARKAMVLDGKRFGRLVVVSRAPRAARDSWWLCRCDCGQEWTGTGTSLSSGRTKSCGCLNLERITSHGLSKTSEYSIWESMITRCTSATSRSWKSYGGRGIRICDEWRHDFTAFLAHVGPRPSPGHSIDRINVNGNYEPGNVRWATAKEQANNKRPRNLEPHEHEQIRWLVKDCGYTGTEVARFYSISHSRIYAIANGRARAA